DPGVAMGAGGGGAEVMLNEQYRESLVLEAAQGGADLLDDDGRQAFGRLIEEQEPRAGPQDPSDRQHLLLAARQGSPAGPEPLLEIREELEDPVYLQPPRPDPP